MSTILSRTTYAYDGAHNRTQKVKDGVTTNYSYNSLNQMTGFTEGDREVSFEYDDNGNRVSRTENSQTDEYSYDCENRLVGVQKGSVAYAYTYDYRTRRVERVEGNTTTKIVFSGGTSAQEYEGDNRTVEYIRGSDYGGGIGGILYTLRDGSRPSYTHYNNRGDVVAKTGPEQEVTYQASYEAFGTRTKEVGQTQDRQKANTKEEDPTGLLNEGFRYRDLETGSFIVRDPLGYKAGPNFYTYVLQNPWTHFDPEGLMPFPYRDVESMEENRQGYAEMAKAAGTVAAHVGDALCKTLTFFLGLGSPFQSEGMRRFGSPLSDRFHYVGGEFMKGMSAEVAPAVSDLLLAVAARKEAKLYSGGLASQMEQAARLQAEARAASKIVSSAKDNPNIAAGDLKNATLTIILARDWYNATGPLQQQAIDQIKKMGATMEQMARAGNEMRNAFRDKARDLMANRKLAEEFASTSPNLSWDEAKKKYGNDFKAILDASLRKNPKVNRDIERRKEQGER